MPRWAQGVFTPRNPGKYLGRGRIRYRSSWELVVCNFCDQHPSVLYWASESISIPYRCPFSQRVRQYIPDFFLVYVDQTGAQRAEVVEVKPLKETGQKKTRSAHNAAQIARNQAKWSAAQAYCERNGFSFRVLTEDQLFRMRGGTQ